MSDEYDWYELIKKNNALLQHLEGHGLWKKYDPANPPVEVDEESEERTFHNVTVHLPGWEPMVVDTLVVKPYKYEPDEDEDEPRTVEDWDSYYAPPEKWA